MGFGPSITRIDECEFKFEEEVTEWVVACCRDACFTLRACLRDAKSRKPIDRIRRRVAVDRMTTFGRKRLAVIVMRIIF